MLDFDVESTGLQPYSGKNEVFLWIFGVEGKAEAITFYPSIWHLVMDERRMFLANAWEAMVIRHLQENHARIQAWFDRAEDEGGIRAWNARFDRSFADMSGCFTVPGDDQWYDGMVEAHAIDERRPVALKLVAQSLFGEEAADPQKALKNWLNEENRRRQKAARDAGQEEYVRANYSDVPAHIIYPYGLEDVILQRRICDIYAQRLEDKPDLRGLIEFERGTSDALYGIEKRGLPAQADEYRKLEQEVISNLSELEDRVQELAQEGNPIIYAQELAGDKWRDAKRNPEGLIWVDVSENGQIRSFEGGAARLSDFNPNSSAQILAALKARGADMSFMSVKDGKVSADADNLRAVDDELAQAILNFRSEFKVLSTYVRPMIGRSYVSTMNVYKEPFIGPDSRIHATYRQVGARTGRMSCADPNMQNQPRDDLRLRYNIVADPGYMLVSCDLSNIEMVLFAAYCGEGKLLQAVRNGDDLHTLTAEMLGLRDRMRPGGGIETARQLGKVYNFTTIYGGGMRSVRRYFRCDMATAKLYKQRYNKAYPEVSRLQHRIECSLIDNGYIQDKLISGRRFRVDPRDAYKATNYLVQGTAAALLKYAVIQLHKDGVPLVALVHDECVAHVPISDAVEIGQLLERRMTEFEGLKGVVPVRAEAAIVKRWSDAKPLKDEHGPYLFTPDWAGGERRRVDWQGNPLISA